MKLFLVILILIALFQTKKCAKILGIFPITGKSHHILATSLMRGLAEKGHDVTIISLFEEKSPPRNGSYRVVTIGDGTVKTPYNMFQVEKMNFVSYALLLNFIGNMYTENVLKDSKVQKLLQSNEQFDAVIVEQFVNDALKYFAYHFNAPLILFSTMTSNSWINSLVANPAPPSYVPEQNVELDHRCFFQRLKNFIVYIFGEINRNFVFYPAQDKLLKKYFPEAPDLNLLLYNASLILINSHLSTNKAMPRVPSMIDIGGFHIKPPKPLPQDLQHYLDNAKEGVIYFSMGSVLQSSNLPAEKVEAILKVFSKLKYQVLWKFETDVLPGQPSNVRLEKWLPQQDILAHPNIKAFITHGGLLSLIESVYHGVPILAIPVYGDQVMNGLEAAKNDFGSYVLYNDLNEATLSKALDDVLHNQRYRENMKRRSKIMHDRQNKPIDEADYWIQYVIRHEGAPHLRVAAMDLPWYQYLSLDVAAFILASVLLFFYAFYILIKFVCCKQKTNTKLKKFKKN